jgi:hypothetical protein
VEADRVRGSTLAKFADSAQNHSSGQLIEPPSRRAGFLWCMLTLALIYESEVPASTWACAAAQTLDKPSQGRHKPSTPNDYTYQARRVAASTILTRQCVAEPARQPERTQDVIVVVSVAPIRAGTLVVGPRAGGAPLSTIRLLGSSCVNCVVRGSVASQPVPWYRGPLISPTRRVI